MGTQTKNDVFFSIPGFPSPISKPPQPRHCIHSTSEKGLGMFALQDLKLNDLILAERPLMLVPDHLLIDADPLLPKDEQKELILSLSEWEFFLQQSFRNMSSGDQAAFLALERGRQAQDGHFRRTVLLNGFPLRLPYGDVLARYKVVFNQLSRVNHSCAPNAFLLFNQLSFSNELVAVRDIKKGEEIVIPYISRAQLLSATSTRQEFLLKAYEFVCQCPACANPASDDIRQGISVSTKNLIQCYLNPSFESDHEKVLNECRQWMEMIESEGLQITPDCGVHLEAAGRASLNLGNMEDYATYAGMRRALSFGQFGIDL